MAKPYSPPTYNVPIFNPNYFQPSSSIDTAKYVANPYEIRTEAFEDIVITNDNVILGNGSSGSGSEIVAIKGTTSTYNNAVALFSDCSADNEFSIGKATPSSSLQRLHLNGFSISQFNNYIVAIPSILTTQSGTANNRFQPTSGLITQNPYLQQLSPSYFQNVSGRDLTVFITATVEINIPSGGSGDFIMAFIANSSGLRFATETTQSVKKSDYQVPSSSPMNTVNVSAWIIMSPNDNFVIQSYYVGSYTTGSNSKLQVIMF